MSGSTEVSQMMEDIETRLVNLVKRTDTEGDEKMSNDDYDRKIQAIIGIIRNINQLGSVTSNDEHNDTIVDMSQMLEKNDKETLQINSIDLI